MSEPIIITIDGPAASGKSSVSRLVAKNLDCDWVSTGAFYRGIAYLALKNNTDIESEEAIVGLIKSGKWSVSLDFEKTKFLFDGLDVTSEIYGESIGNIASKISSFPEVRKELLACQRDCANGRKFLVAEGRDCGTVVFPNAQSKFYLTANSRNRAARRAQQEGADIEKTLKDQAVRDSQDGGRAVAPMAAPEGAHIIDSSNMGLDDVVQAVLAAVKSDIS